MDILTGLNPEQRTAVTATAGPVLVLAGPGSGKTRVLTHRIAHLVQERLAAAWQIMAVTFTNKAAREMRERTERLLGADLRGLPIGTFHSLCASLLRREAEHLTYSSNFVIYDSADQLALVRQVLKEMNLDEKLYSPWGVLNTISRAKNELIGPDAYTPATYREEVISRIYARYQQLLLMQNAMDFDDLLMVPVLLLRANDEVRRKYQARYQYVLVDEFQDTNGAQYELTRLLVGPRRNIFVVGDPDQSIYRFRGADFRNLLRFRDDYPDATVVNLNRNYRSTQTILDTANAVIASNPHRKPVDMVTDQGYGAKVQIFEAYDENEEAAFVVDTIASLVLEGRRPGDAAVMYRTNAQSRALEEAFIRRSLPYKLVGATRFYERKEVKDALAFLRAIHNPLDWVSLSRIINVPPRSIGGKTLSTLEQWARELGKTPFEALALALTGAGATATPAPDAPPTHPFDRRALGALRDFYELHASWLRLRASATVAELLEAVLKDTGLEKYMRDGTGEGDDRWNNVLELRNVAARYANIAAPDNLTLFLEEVALVADADDLPEQSNAPTLLTLHTAKGLEFPIVFMVGMEDGLLPHARSLEDPEEMEEERRLAYVGITRAKERLYLTHAFRRTRWGSDDVSSPSRFLQDIPAKLMEGRSLRARTDAARSAARATTTWGRRGDEDHATTEARGDSARSAQDSTRPASSTVWSPSRAAPAVPSTRPTQAVRPGGSSQFKIGDRVSHGLFGEGTVISSQVRGDDEEVTVAFKNKGIKKLLTSLANLRKLTS
ncbi:MAG: UvrD-helicase domain-containing protein [Anaerolineae bacterium]